MANRINWLTLKSKKVLYIDLSNLNTRQIDAAIGVIELAETNANLTTELLLLFNFNDFFINDDLLKTLKNFVKKISSNLLKGAVVYNTDTKVSIIQSINTFSGIKLSMFEDLTEAKNWLVK